MLLCLCAVVGLSVSCERPPVSKDFSVLSTATRIKVTEAGFRDISIVTDPDRIKAARDFIKKYEAGWKSPRWQGATGADRRFDFWDGDRYLGEFGINPDTITTDNYYQEAPADEIARLAALFELQWPARE
jgi:hypothetical protein